MEGDISEKFNYSRTARMLNPHYPQRNLIFALRCTAGIVQLTYLVVNAVFVIIDSIATTTFRLISRMSGCKDVNLN